MRSVAASITNKLPLGPPAKATGHTKELPSESLMKVALPGKGLEDIDVRGRSEGHAVVLGGDLPSVTKLPLWSSDGIEQPVVVAPWDHCK